MSSEEDPFEALFSSLFPSTSSIQSISSNSSIFDLPLHDYKDLNASSHFNPESTDTHFIPEFATAQTVCNTSYQHSHITELIGEAGSGKTAISTNIIRQYVLPEILGGFGGRAVVISTTESLLAYRKSLSQISLPSSLTPPWLWFLSYAPSTLALLDAEKLYLKYIEGYSVEEMINENSHFEDNHSNKHWELPHLSRYRRQTTLFMFLELTSRCVFHHLYQLYWKIDNNQTNSKEPVTETHPCYLQLLTVWHLSSPPTVYANISYDDNDTPNYLYDERDQLFARSKKKHLFCSTTPSFYEYLMEYIAIITQVLVHIGILPEITLKHSNTHRFPKHLLFANYFAEYWCNDDDSLYENYAQYTALLKTNDNALILDKLSTTIIPTCYLPLLSFHSVTTLPQFLSVTDAIYQDLNLGIGNSSDKLYNNEKNQKEKNGQHLDITEQIYNENSSFLEFHDLCGRNDVLLHTCAAQHHPEINIAGCFLCHHHTFGLKNVQKTLQSSHLYSIQHAVPTRARPIFVVIDCLPSLLIQDTLGAPTDPAVYHARQHKRRRNPNVDEESTESNSDYEDIDESVDNLEKDENIEITQKIGITSDQSQKVTTNRSDKLAGDFITINLNHLPTDDDCSAFANHTLNLHEIHLLRSYASISENLHLLCNTMMEYHQHLLHDYIYLQNRLNPNKTRRIQFFPSIPIKSILFINNVVNIIPPSSISDANVASFITNSLVNRGDNATKTGHSARPNDITTAILSSHHRPVNTQFTSRISHSRVSLLRPLGSPSGDYSAWNMTATRSFFSSGRPVVRFARKEMFLPSYNEYLGQLSQHAQIQNQEDFLDAIACAVADWARIHCNTRNFIDKCGHITKEALINSKKEAETDHNTMNDQNDIGNDQIIDDSESYFEEIFALTADTCPYFTLPQHRNLPDVFPNDQQLQLLLPVYTALHHFIINTLQGALQMEHPQHFRVNYLINDDIMNDSNLITLKKYAQYPIVGKLQLFPWYKYHHDLEYLLLHHFNENDFELNQYTYDIEKCHKTNPSLCSYCSFHELPTALSITPDIISTTKKLAGFNTHTESNETPTLHRIAARLQRQVTFPPTSSSIRLMYINKTPNGQCMGRCFIITTLGVVFVGFPFVINLLSRRDDEINP